MVVRTRLRSVMVPLALHCAAAAISSYFVWHALNGQRGLKTRTEYEKQIAELQGDLDKLAVVRSGWNRRIALMRGDGVDRDLLDEESRIMLGRTQKYEVVILDPDKSQTR